MTNNSPVQAPRTCPRSAGTNHHPRRPLASIAGTPPRELPLGEVQAQYGWVVTATFRTLAGYAGLGTLFAPLLVVDEADSGLAVLVLGGVFWE